MNKLNRKIEHEIENKNRYDYTSQNIEDMASMPNIPDGTILLDLNKKEYVKRGKYAMDTKMFHSVIMAGMELFTKRNTKEEKV